MANLVLILLLLPWLTFASCVPTVQGANDANLSSNYSDSNKELYVINAMVYQVGIVTNKTDDETAKANTTGNQEAVTFYHTNGSQVDLSKIANPLITNVTAQSLVGVAPVPGHIENAPYQLPWNTLSNLANISPSSDSTGSEQLKASRRLIRSIGIMDSDTPLNRIYRSLFKRDVPGGTPVSIHSGATVIPQAAGIRSFAIPPLLTLNNNLSDILVPMPNTSVVHYAKINTLLTKP